MNNPRFDACADLILSTLEEAFSIVCVGDRDHVKRTIVNLLGYYCVPRSGDLTVDELTEQLRVRGFSVEPMLNAPVLQEGAGRNEAVKKCRKAVKI